MAEEVDPYRPPAARTQAPPPEPLRLSTAIHLLVKVLFVLSTVGAGALSLFASKGQVMPSLMMAVVYGLAAIVVGFIPLALGAAFYLRLHEAGRGTGVNAQLVALVAVVLPVGVLSLVGNFSMGGFAGAVLFCYLHAGPTAAFAHSRLGAMDATTVANRTAE